MGKIFRNSPYRSFRFIHFLKQEFFKNVLETIVFSYRIIRKSVKLTTFIFIFPYNIFKDFQRSAVFLL